jgi:hypothetical protein
VSRESPHFREGRVSIENERLKGAQSELLESLERCFARNEMHWNNFWKAGTEREQAEAQRDQLLEAINNSCALLEECSVNAEKGQDVLYSWFLGEMELIHSTVVEARQTIADVKGEQDA